jgi:nitric oxide reductase subunit C
VLSKSQARLFFLGGTAFFFAIFLFLTVDTLGQVPERSNEQNLSESAVRGKHLFDRKNCMGCHTILGEGAYYAPELTKVYDRRGPEWMAIFLADPQAMFPGQRKMTQYNFTQEEITDLIAFLKWIGEIDTNGFPREPDLKLAGAAPVVVAALQSGVEPPGFYTTVCRACHAVGGEGGGVGPALDGVATRYTRQELHTWLSDPGAVKPGTAMPNLNLSDELRGELVDWLVTLE